MAISTATTLTTHVLAKYIQAQIRENLRPALVLGQMISQFDLRGKNSSVYSSAQWPTLTAAAVAESADIANTTLTTTGNDITASEVGIRVDLTDFGREVSNIDPNMIAQRCTIAVAQKIESDIAALFTGFSTTAGSTGVELTLSVLTQAIKNLDVANAMGKRWMVLHPHQISVIRGLIAGTSGSTAAFYGTGIVDPSVKEIPGYAMDFLGVPVFMSTHVPTANAGADYCGALFTADALGMAILRDPTVEFQRDASARLTEVVVTAAYGVAEIGDLSGTRVLSDFV